VASGWFDSLKWWEQDVAYAAFDRYREDPSDENFDDVINKTLPVIRVVYATQKFRPIEGDEDDLIAHAALTITKALPKMRLKSTQELGNDKQYVRYLFTCVSHAFYREFEVLHGKSNKLYHRLCEYNDSVPTYTSPTNVKALEAELTLQHVPEVMFSLAMECVRFEGQERKICQYMLNQLLSGREIAKSVLQLMGCKDRTFFDMYCNAVLLQAFFLLRQRKPMEVDASFEGFYEEVDLDDFDLQDVLGDLAS
jgi:hypothetical protein